MAYVLHGHRPLIFVANPRTGSTAIAQAMRLMGATTNGHHLPPRYIPEDSIVFQTIRSHFAVLNSLWWKGRAGGSVKRFLEIVSSGTYEHAPIPYYRFSGVTHSIRYENLEADFKWICQSAGFNPPKLERTPTRTEKPAAETFDGRDIALIQDLYHDEMERYNLPTLP